MEYNDFLKEQFGHLVIDLVKHDTSPCGMPCYIEVVIGRMPKAKDRGQFVLDLGNYVYRLGLRYQHPPEYNKRGKVATVRFYMSWADVEPIKANIIKACGKDEGMAKFEHYLPFEFSSLIVQNPARGVFPKEAA